MGRRLVARVIGPAAGERNDVVHCVRARVAAQVADVGGGEDALVLRLDSAGVAPHSAVASHSLTSASSSTAISSRRCSQAAGILACLTLSAAISAAMVSRVTTVSIAPPMRYRLLVASW